jgi:choline kinase
MVNGDTVHPVGIERTLLAARAGDGTGDGTGDRAGDGAARILLAVDDVKPLADEEMKVTLGSTGHLAKITKLMDPEKAYGEYIGATLIEPEAAEPLAAALRATWERNPDLYYEDGYQEYVNRGGKIAVAPIGAVDWVEVDNHDDLRRAREIACRY